MAESLRRRPSKWDVVAEPQVLIIQTDAPSMKADEDTAMNSDWNSSKFGASTLSPPSEVKADLVKKNNERVEDKSREWTQREDSNVRVSSTSSLSPRFPKLPDIDIGDGDYMKHSYREPLSRNHSTGKDGDLNRTGDRWNKSLEQNYGTSLSPCRDGWKQQSPPISPKRSWSRSHRSRSRSRSRSRKRSRSRSMSPSYGFRWGPERSRSRSPPYGSRRGPEKWSDRGRMGGGQAVACRDFAAGRCQRGSECRFLHEDTGRRPSNRYYDSGTSDTRESRAEQGRISGHGIRENFTESREQSDYPRDRFSRNDRPTTRCYDFIKGRCQRGSECRYAHDEVSYNSGWGARDESRAWTRDGRDVDSSLGRRPDPPRRRASDTPCKFFSEGRCSRGEACRFSHQVVGSHDHKPHDDRSDYMAIDASNSSWKGQNQGDQPVVIDTSHPFPWTVSDNDARTDDSRLKPQHSQSEVPESNIHQIQPQEASNLHAMASVPGQMQGGQGQYIASQPIQTLSFTPNVQIQQLVPPMPLNGQMQPAIFSLPQNGQGQFIAPQVPSINVPMHNLPVLPPSHSGLSQQNYNLPPPSHSGQNQPNFNLSGQIQQNIPLPLLNGQNQLSLNFTGQSHQPLPPPQDVQNQNVASQPLNPESLILNEQLMQREDTSEKQPSQLNSDTPQVPSINVPMHNLPVLPPSHSGLSQQNYNLPPPSHSGQNQPNFNLSGQIQQNVPLPLLNGQNQLSLNFAGQSHQTLPPPQDVQNQNVASQPLNPESLSLNEQLMQRADTSEKQPSQLNSDTPLTPKVVTSEQAAQITNLSASLARFFGSASALNPQIATGLVPLVQPNQSSFTQHQTNLTSGNLEPMNPDANNRPPGFERKDLAIHEAQTNVDISVPLSVIGDTNIGNLPSDGVDLEVKVVQGNEGTAAMEEIETENVHSKKEQADDVEADGDGKQSKDVKAMRMFKGALVEFVKDALKPSWKEGQLSKEAHKTIVKKVVDKVTGAMQSQSIPQTQEKIDIYMSHSKGKLTKLVQAYVEKYVKG